MADWFEQAGIILFVGNFEPCLRFYRDTLELEVLFDKGTLVALKFGSGYLMVESGGVSSASTRTRAQNPTTLRFNVLDVEAAAEWLRGKGVAVEVSVFEWGTIGAFEDPDGNRCELKNHGDGYFMAGQKPAQ